MSLFIINRKPVVGYSDYLATSDGYVIRSARRRKRDGKTIPETVLIPYYTKMRNKSTGYAIVTLSKCGKVRKFTVHKLVYEAFNDVLHKGMVIDHKDGCKQNNSLLNLEGVSIKENVVRAFSNRQQPTEFRRSICKTTPEMFDKLCSDISYGLSIEFSERKNGIPHGTVKSILAGKSYKSLYKKVYNAVMANTEIKHPLKRVAHRNA